MNPKPNDIVICPFDKSHQIEHYRLQVHLTKCSKQHRDKNIAVCPFDATHIVRDVELDHHVTNCPGRRILDEQIYVTDDFTRPPVKVVQQTADFSCSENWDNENVESYKPDPTTKPVPMYSKVKGATPSERKRFRVLSALQYSQARDSMAREGSSSQK